jgi:hypothetical protein
VCKSESHEARGRPLTSVPRQGLFSKALLCFPTPGALSPLRSIFLSPCHGKMSEPPLLGSDSLKHPSSFRIVLVVWRRYERSGLVAATIGWQTVVHMMSSRGDLMPVTPRKWPSFDSFVAHWHTMTDGSTVNLVLSACSLNSHCLLGCWGRESQPDSFSRARREFVVW